MDKTTRIALAALAVLAVAVVLGAVWFLSSQSATLSVTGPVGTGFTTTALSFTNITSNYANITGRATIATLVLNGKGENLTGIKPSQLNSSYSGGQTVTLSANVTNYGEAFEYDQDPAGYLYSYKITYISSINSASVKTFSCPLGFGCSFTLSSSTNTTYLFSLTWASAIGTGDTAAYQSTFNNFMQIFYTACNAAGGQAILSGGPSVSVFGVAAGADYAMGSSFQCIVVQGSPYAAIYNAGHGFYDTYNITVKISNSSQTSTLYINNNNPDAYDKATHTTVIGAGIQGSGYSLNEQNIPTIAYLYAPWSGSPRYLAVPYISTSEITGSPVFTPVSSITALLAPYANTYGVHSSGALSYLQSLNNQVQNLTYPVKGTQFDSLNLSQFNGCPNGSGFLISCSPNSIATLQFKNTTTFYTEITVVMPFSTFGNVGITIPVAQPQILSVSPSPVTALSSQQVTPTFTVKNYGTVTGSVYLTGECNNNVFSTATTPVSIAPNQQLPVEAPFDAPVNPNNGTTTVFNCIAMAHSVGNIYNSTAFSFQLDVNGNPKPGATYYNTTGNGKAVTPQGGNINVSTGKATNSSNIGKNQTGASCHAGYTLTGGVCLQNAGCPMNYTESGTSSTGAPLCVAMPQQQSLGIGWYIAAIVIVIVIIFAGGYAFAKKGKRRRKR